MRLIDISRDNETTYRLRENERAIFMMNNRDGKITFELAGHGATAHVFAFYEGTDAERFAPRIIQRHLASGTVSSSTVRARLDGSSLLRFRGLVDIAKDATGSDARQNCRILLLSPDATAHAGPELEISTDDVTCSHAASIAPPDPDQLYFLATRGLETDKATALLADGFFRDARDEMERLSQS
ncbi:MAG: SufD family Fe-S cluster assembly protein [Candidatus Moranbacteria bacterium]|nr:SufD family Fe-S cluster assembly protein [Candidatus Moranbacteria bacterium]